MLVVRRILAMMECAFMPIISMKHATILLPVSLCVVPAGYAEVLMVR